jgi:hypothetical protein
MADVSDFTDQPDWDAKYVVFARKDFSDMVWGNSNWQPWEVRDAVVIRRQDLFASPCLATYAACIGIVAQREQDPKIKAELLSIADYFERQAQLAADEGFKLPTV